MGQISGLLLQEYLGKKSPKYDTAEPLFRVLQNNYSHGIVCPYVKKPSPALRNSWLLVWILRSENFFFLNKIISKTDKNSRTFCTAIRKQLSRKSSCEILQDRN